MNYECVWGRSSSNEMMITVREGAELPRVQPGLALVEVECVVAETSLLAREEPAHPARCGLVGRVVEVGAGEEQVRIGDRVSAVGPADSRVLLPVSECLVVPDQLDPYLAAHWALLAALVQSLNRLRIEIGEAVLVHGEGLRGYLAAQLAFRAGAALVVGLDPQRRETDGAPTALRWVADEEAAAKALPDGEADVLIDAVGDSAQLSGVLPLVKMRGRVLLLTGDEARPVDFNFYPDVHRRSLQVIGGALPAARQPDWSGDGGDAYEPDFIRYLVANDRVGLAQPATAYVRPAGPTQQTLPASNRRLVVQWQAKR